MKEMFLVAIIILMGVDGVAYAGELSSKNSCKNDPDVVAECFDVRGRLSLYNGTPSARIWIVGTKRFLGIRDNDETNIGAMNDLSKELSFDKDAYANFLVCPLTPHRKGIMQTVCIETASNVLIKPHSSHSGEQK